jgi:hypothetical protein
LLAFFIRQRVVTPACRESRVLDRPDGLPVRFRCLWFRSGPHTMLMLHSALQCCAPFLECIEHSVHSKSLALKCTRHSVHSTQWTLSTQCHSPYRHSVLSASIVCGPCSGPSRHTGGRRCSGSAVLNCAAPGPALPPDPRSRSPA